MQANPVIDTMLDHRSVRKYTDEMPPDDVVETPVSSLEGGYEADYLVEPDHVKEGAGV